MSSVLETSTDEQVATLTLNRPEARNALSPELMDALAAELERLDRMRSSPPAPTSGR